MVIFLIERYEIVKDGNEEILIIYLNYKYEFSKDFMNFENDNNLKEKIKKCRYYFNKTVFIFDGEKYQTHLLLPFNMENLNLVLGYFKRQGFQNKAIKESLFYVLPLSGRMEKVSDNVFVDYAHTYESVKKVLKQCKKYFLNSG